jgi:hypothetical protein
MRYGLRLFDDFTLEMIALPEATLHVRHGGLGTFLRRRVGGKMDPGVRQAFAGGDDAGEAAPSIAGSADAACAPLVPGEGRGPISPASRWWMHGPRPSPG